MRANDAKTDESRHEELPESLRNTVQQQILISNSSSSSAMRQRRRLTPAKLQGGLGF
jgi:hypothetical protein